MFVETGVGERFGMALIRPAGESDLPAILEIYNDIIARTTAVYDYAPHTLAMRREWFLGLQSWRLPVLAAVDAERLIGFGSLAPFRKWGAYKYSVESSIYVAADRRGQGIGAQLLAPLIDAARQRQMHTIIAGIDAQNDASIRLHARFGFREVARFRQVGFKFDRWLDLIFMQLMLETPDKPVDG
jgi:phosphinothricin acetyltransferase